MIDRLVAIRDELTTSILSLARNGAPSPGDPRHRTYTDRLAELERVKAQIRRSSGSE